MSINGRVGKFEEDIQRRTAISCLAKCLSKARDIAHGTENLVEVEKDFVRQQQIIGSGLRFYDSLGIIDDATYNRVIKVCDKISESFYKKYNSARKSTQTPHQ